MMKWKMICSVSDLQANSGICALLNDQQIAVFYLPQEDKIYAIANYDPIGKANVLSRGIVGDLQGQTVVASPLYKHHFNLVTGHCLEDSGVQVAVFSARIVGQCVEISTEEIHHAI
jgi:nitrite reductase (NADH) small subunit